MFLDLLFFLLGGLIDLLSSLLPPLPPALSDFVSTLQSSIAGLAQNIPYGDLLPWPTIATFSILYPSMIVLAVGIRTLRRVFAWVRSRGTADE